MRGILLYVCLLVYLLSFGQNVQKNDSTTLPENMRAINLSEDNYWPAISADNQFFATTVSHRDDVPTLSSKESLIIFQRDSVGKWQRNSALTASLNIPGNVGSPAFSTDGRYLFFVASDRQDGCGSCDIYYVIRHGNRWSRMIHPEAPLNTRYWESNPSLSADGKTLYFSSNRPGGVGGMDIWKCSVQVQPDGLLSFYNVENLGATINTSKNESSPFIHPDNKTLYFASDGHPGLGKNDLFLSRLDASGHWQKPQNLGVFINTPGDDAGFVVEADGKYGYFSSNGIDTTNHKRQIYRIALPENCRPEMVKCLTGRVTDADTRIPIRATVELVDLALGKIINTVTTDTETGKFSICYPSTGKFGAVVSGRAVLFESIAITDTMHRVDIALSKIVSGRKITLRNLYFAFDSYQLQSESMPELRRLGRFLIDYPLVKIEIAGHTDNTGTEQYNKELSQKRAKAVADYLIQGGIASDRLTYCGYGATQPVASNDTEQGRALNRRTEAVIK